MKEINDMKITSRHFNELLWPIFIKPAIECAIDDIDDNFKKDANLNCFFLEDEKKYRDELSSLYKRKKRWLKRIYFGYAENLDEKLLDLHKIAAIICRCVIGCKPFSFDVGKANEYKMVNKKNNDYIY